MKFTKYFLVVAAAAMAFACAKESAPDELPQGEPKESQSQVSMLSFVSLDAMKQQINTLSSMESRELDAWYAAKNFESQGDAAYRVAEEIENAASLAEAEAIKAKYASFFLFNDNPSDEELFNPFIPNENPDYTSVCNINGEVMIGGQVVNFNTITDVKDTHEYQLTHRAITRADDNNYERDNVLKRTVGKHKFWAEGRYEPKDDFVKVEFTAHHKGTFGWNKCKQKFHLRQGRTPFPQSWEYLSSIGQEVMYGKKDFWTDLLNPHRLKDVGRIAIGKTASMDMLIYSAGTGQGGEGRLLLIFKSNRSL